METSACSVIFVRRTRMHSLRGDAIRWRANGHWRCECAAARLINLPDKHPGSPYSFLRDTSMDFSSKKWKIARFTASTERRHISIDLTNDPTYCTKEIRVKIKPVLPCSWKLVGRSSPRFWGKAYCSGQLLFSCRKLVWRSPNGVRSSGISSPYLFVNDNY